MNISCFACMLAMVHIVYWPAEFVQSAVYYQSSCGYVAGWSRS